MAVQTKTSRIDIRLSIEDKETIEKAAKCNRQTLSNYIISVVIKQAEIDLSNNETIVLSNKERDALLNSLENPPLPNEKLKRLFK